MDEISVRMLHLYLTMVNERYKGENITLDILMNPQVELLDEFQDILAGEIVDISKINANKSIQLDIEQFGTLPTQDRIDSQNDYFLAKETLLRYIDILQDVYIYLYLNPSSENEEFLNALINANTENVVSHFLDDGDIAYKLLTCYIRYLVCKSEALITSAEEHDAIQNNRFIWNISNTKGYDTLSDMIRTTIMELYNDLINVHGLNRDVYKVMDEFLLGNSRLHYFMQNGIDVRNKKYLEIVKKYMIRIVLADALADIKLDEEEIESYEDNEDGTFDLNELEIRALEHIDECIENGVYTLPNDEEVRVKIYEHFTQFNTEITSFKREQVNTFDEEVHEKIKTLNPLSILD